MKLHRIKNASYAALCAATLCSCASTAKHAVRYGERSKLVVDEVADATADYIDGRADACKHIEESEAFDDCLGPIASDPDEVDIALESVRAAQVALFIAVAAADPQGIQDAVKDLAVAMERIARLAKKLQEARTNG